MYCDFRATSPVTAGEMILASEQGWIAADIKADLTELIAGYDPDTAPTRCFRSTGLGIEDRAIASLLLRAGARRSAAAAIDIFAQQAHG